MTDLIKTYFDAFNNKDLTTLSELYADNIVLNEWNENVFEGKDAVLEENKKLFDKFGNVNISIISAGTDEDFITATSYISLNEISVILDDEVDITVVDIIEVIDNKIRSITAYRGF